MRKLNVVSALMALSLTFTACPTEDGNNNSRSIGYAMVSVPGGSFQMGNPDNYSDSERPVHTVTLSAFSIGKYEVTQAQYQTVTGNNPSNFSGSNLPVERVTWFDAVEFCNKLSQREGLQAVYTISGRRPSTGYPITSAIVMANWSKNGYRLPTEAQWEYAAKGGNESPENYTYAGSNDVNGVAWYSGNSDSKTHEVGTKAPNGLGLYDMSGNVWEWCWDWYDSYSSEAQTDPDGVYSGAYRVRRGGGWTISAELVRSAYRGNRDPSGRDDYIGFRLVRPAQ